MSRLFARIGLRSTLAVLSTVLMVLALAVAFVPRASAADDNHTMNVRGYVYDNAGRKIANADVTVTMYNGLIPGVSKTTTSSVSTQGYFSVNFATGEWANGNKILVVAQYQGGAQGTNETATAHNTNFFEWENVTLPYEIPQFGSTVGLLVTVGLVGVIAAVALVWRRKAK